MKIPKWVIILAIIGHGSAILGFMYMLIFGF